MVTKTKAKVVDSAQVSNGAAAIIDMTRPFKVTISVGSIPHVMETGHHIQRIDLYSGENLLANVLLTPVFTRAVATITVVKGGAHKSSTLRAVERCNLHGLWEARKEISVE